MKPHRLNAPLLGQDLAALRSGDSVLLSGIVHTARDAAHQRIFSLLDQGRELPFDLEGAVVYYTGPSPAPPGRPLGSAGPTTSYRMDAFAPRLYALGMKASIGKGRRSPEVLRAIREHGGLYLGATGGAGAMLGLCVRSARVVAFPELGPEAVYELEVRDMPLLVVNDCHGGELYAAPDRRVIEELE